MVLTFCYPVEKKGHEAEEGLYLAEATGQMGRVKENGVYVGPWMNEVKATIGGATDTWYVNASSTIVLTEEDDIQGEEDGEGNDVQMQEDNTQQVAWHSHSLKHSVKVAIQLLKNDRTSKSLLLPVPLRVAPYGYFARWLRCACLTYNEGEAKKMRWEPDAKFTKKCPTPMTLPLLFGTCVSFRNACASWTPATRTTGDRRVS